MIESMVNRSVIESSVIERSMIGSIENDRQENCWEFNGCGREPGGENVLRHGLCPVSVQGETDGIHHGKNGGRCCWVLRQTLYKGHMSCLCLHKEQECRECAFYNFIGEREELLILA